MDFFREILKELKIRHTASYAEALLAGQDGKYTLYGVKKLLETYGVKLTAIRIGSKDVAQLDYPCIVIYPNYPVLIKSAPEDLEDFRHTWNGVALVIDETAQACEPHYYQNQAREALVKIFPYGVACCLLILIVLSFFGRGCADWYKLLLLAFSGAGAFFSWRTVQGECSSSCHSVLESPASKLFGLYSLGTIGLAYFASNITIYLTIPAFEPTVALFSAPALLMPLWSIPYQKFVARAWCKNCLGVQLMLVLAFLAAMLFHRIDIERFQVWPVVGTLALYVVVFYVCEYVYRLLQKNKSVPQSMIYNYKALLRDPVVRQRILESGEQRDTQGASGLILHQPADDTGKEILIVLSPSCPHCRTLFFKMRELLALGKLKEYKVSLLFLSSTYGLPVYGSIICEYQQYGADAAMRLLAEWYDSLKLKPFQKKFDACKKDDLYLEELNRQQEWGEKQNLTGVPVLLVNSRIVNHSLIDGII